MSEIWEARTYKVGCHGGKVRNELETALAPVLDCNCSICRKRGALWTYVEPSAFKLLSGEGHLTDYLFNKRNIHHLFCSTCVVASFARGSRADGAEGIRINVRCLDGIDLVSLKLTPFDGRSL